jgi:hypothetical protein
VEQLLPAVNAGGSIKLMGIDPAEYKGVTGKPIAAAIR